jgi:hypothetical protein
VHRARQFGEQAEHLFTGDIADVVMQCEIAREFGWTLDYVRSLDDWTLVSILGVMDGWRKPIKGNKQ